MIKVKAGIKMERPIAIDLYSGVGGLSLGIEAAGFDIIAAVEEDVSHSKYHHINFPYTENINKKVKDVDPDYLRKLIREKKRKELDLLMGGPPCQGFSMAGKRDFLDSRNQEVYEFVRKIEELNPKFFIFENVPGITQGNYRFFLEDVIGKMQSLGYNITEPLRLLNGFDFGAPQTRKRLIILGSRKDQHKLAYPSSSPLFLNVEEAISDLSSIEPFLGEDETINFNYLDYEGKRNLFYPGIPSGVYRLCHQRRFSSMVFNHVGSNHQPHIIERFRSTPIGTKEKISRLYRLHPDKLCTTLRAGTPRDKGSHTAPRPIHYKYPRCITVREAARIHTYPDWFIFHPTIWKGFMGVGNSVIPTLAKRLGDSVIEVLGIPPDSLPRYTLDGISL